MLLDHCDTEFYRGLCAVCDFVKFTSSGFMLCSEMCNYVVLVVVGTGSEGDGPYCCGVWLGTGVGLKED